MFWWTLQILSAADQLDIQVLAKVGGRGKMDMVSRPKRCRVSGMLLFVRNQACTWVNGRAEGMHFIECDSVLFS